MNLSLGMYGFNEIVETIKKHEKHILNERKKVMNVACLRIVRDSKINITNNNSVITGNLRASMEHNIKEIGHTIIGNIGSNVYYAPYVEFRKPFLRPAYESNLEQTVKDFKEILKKAPF